MWEKFPGTSARITFSGSNNAGLNLIKSLGWSEKITMKCAICFSLFVQIREKRIRINTFFRFYVCFDYI